MLTGYALDLLRRDLKSRIAYAQYRIGEQFYRAKIASSEVMADGRVAASFVIGHAAPEENVVNRVQLYDHNGKLLAEKNENIRCKDEREGILYQFRFTIAEE